MDIIDNIHGKNPLPVFEGFFYRSLYKNFAFYYRERKHGAEKFKNFVVGHDNDKGISHLNGVAPNNRKFS